LSVSICKEGCVEERRESLFRSAGTIIITKI
jgi:hypothetical protein